jgi:uncharacterized paraquat-inducible protein A
MASQSERSRLYQVAHRRTYLPALEFVAGVLLVLGLVLPVVTLEELAVQRHTYSVLSGVYAMLTSDEVFLGLIILCFSVIFPMAKLGTLVYLWYGAMEVERRRRWVRWLRTLGKWSMLDVFVVILFVGAVRLGILAKATAHVGILVFAGAILLSLVATFLTAGCVEGPQSAPRPTARVRILPLLCLLSLGLFVAGIVTPLMTLEKWIFWSSTYSIVSGAGRLLQQHSPLLAGGFILLVIALPLLEHIGLLVLSVLQLTRARPARLATLILTLDEWGMADVFALALFVAATKLSDLVNVQPRAGLWLYAGATALCAWLSWWMRRLYAWH